MIKLILKANENEEEDEKKKENMTINQ